jgi:hypothetical protein
MNLCTPKWSTPFTFASTQSGRSLLMNASILASVRHVNQKSVTENERSHGVLL